MSPCLPIASAMIAVLLASPPPAPPTATWNDCGHRVIAAIAFEQMEPVARQAVVDLLREHPAARDAAFWRGHEGNGDDPDLNLFLNASVFPDDARRPGPFTRYDVGRAHYVNFRIMVGPDGRVREVLPPIQDPGDDDPHGDVLESLAANVALAGDRSAAPDDRALALSWIFHQVGDLHQPLHNVARFAPATPDGDRGGNDIRFGEYTLHGFWDWALGGDASAEAVDALAAALVAEHPRASFANRLAWKEPVEWSREGVRLALRYAYNNLDFTVGEFPEPPIGYEADATNVARSQCALAGYRLADLLSDLVAE
ncbi:S1/P1 nuclease [Tautonia plasticadhaerens]|uniref:S1/P1 Nuclease n=1 Tax=Tautonia plasticadhaerens TaxID=2527974 RepID=A0A518H5D9_9BACT|nr:S1/P1 nuclease [Tautonia plasticadhaerens]QDV36042.1 S1/P1 Nuclease [Tautonia plasticadhaerens]